MHVVAAAVEMSDGMPSRVMNTGQFPGHVDRRERGVVAVVAVRDVRGVLAGCVKVVGAGVGVETTEKPL
jgi:hypothetical protein